MAKVINQSEFKELVLDNEGVVLVDFFATWCGPCKMLTPVLEEVSAEAADGITVYKVDIDQDHQLAMDYGVEAVPTMGIFKKGQLVDVMVGFSPKATIVDKLNYYNN